jgi:hypothetical protein
MKWRGAGGVRQRGAGRGAAAEAGPTRAASLRSSAISSMPCMVGLGCTLGGQTSLVRLLAECLVTSEVRKLIHHVSDHAVHHTGRSVCWLHTW